MAIGIVQIPTTVQDALRAAELELVDLSEWSDDRAQRAQLDAVLVGTEVRYPVQSATRAYRVDPGLGVVILGEDRRQCERIRAALRFAPMIGRDVTCVEAPLERVPDIVAAAAARTRTRRSHRSSLRSASSLKLDAGNKPLALRERYAAQLMELAPVGIVACDLERRVVSANAEAARMLALSERDMLGVSLGDPRFELDAALLDSLLHDDVGRTFGPFTFGRDAGGTKSVIEARAVCVRDSSGSGFLLVMQDITRRMQLERQRELDLARVQEANRLKDEFLATVSHELRTPLNAILGWARLLRAGLAADRHERALETIERNALAQAQLVEDLLDITRITSGKMRIEVQDVQLVEVVEAAIETVRPSLEGKQLRLTTTLDPTAGQVAGDPHRLQQVVWNLLSNAVKFCPSRSGHIKVLLERVDSHVELTVSDNGPGIAPDFLPHVFGSFRQADGSATRRHGGLGLGLAISKHLVELHGGSIHAHSEGLGKGASFTVRMPVAAVRALPRTQPARERAHPPEPPRELFQLRVLVVDDEPDARELVADILSTCGALVRVAGSVAEACARLDEELPDVMVSDIGMPGEDGYALIAKLRARPREAGGSMPVAALSAYARAEDRRRALRAGFQMHVAKPVEPDELIAVVATLARMAKLIR